MTLVDTHAHLDFRHFDKDRQAVLQRAREAGVGAIVTVGTDLDSSRQAVALAAQQEPVYAAVGMHPHDASKLDGQTLAELRFLAQEPKVLAVGEIGLDYYRNRSPRDAQRRAFRAQLAWAAKLGKPVIVHDRDAHDEIVEILTDWAAGLEGSTLSGRLGVLHTFSGDLAMAEAIIELGFYISISGPVTYPSEGGLRDIVKSVPMERLLVETDCPFLVPVPHPRRARNEPAYVRLVAQQIAELKEMTLDDCARATTENARRLFGTALGLAQGGTQDLIEDRRMQAPQNDEHPRPTRGEVD